VREKLLRDGVLARGPSLREGFEGVFGRCAVPFMPSVAGVSSTPFAWKELAVSEEAMFPTTHSTVWRLAVGVS
jgi:hypothetical protein